MDENTEPSATPERAWSTQPNFTSEWSTPERSTLEDPTTPEPAAPSPDDSIPAWWAPLPPPSVAARDQSTPTQSAQATDWTAPTAYGWTPTPPVTTPVTAAPIKPAASQRSSGVRGIVGAAVLSAALASGATFALFSAAGFAPAAAATTAPTQSNGATATTTPAAVAAATTSDAATMVANARKSVVTITTTISLGGFRGGSGTGVGTGVIVASNGTILTNAHVVEGATSIKVTLPNGDEATGTVLASDTDADLAILKVNATGLTAATLGDSDAIRVGDAVVAIGTPLGQYEDSVTAGIISAKDRTITVRDEFGRGGNSLSGLLQTDAAINPGNSGGPLLNARGDVVGIVTAGDESGQGIGFAIPINAAKSMVAKAA